MKTDCIQPQDLPRVLALPAHDLQRQHLEECPHCRAMAHAYAEFMDADGFTPGFDADAAEAELATRLAAVIEGPQPVRWQGPRAERRRFFTPQRAWFAAAAVLLICAGIFLAQDAVLLRDARLPEGGGLVRGETVDATEFAWVQDDDGAWRLTWNVATPGTPQLVYLDAELKEMAHRPLPAAGSVPATEVVVPDETLYLQLVFEDKGDVVARSAVIAARPQSP